MRTYPKWSDVPECYQAFFKDCLSGFCGPVGVRVTGDFLVPLERGRYCCWKRYKGIDGSCLVDILYRNGLSALLDGLYQLA